MARIEVLYRHELGGHCGSGALRDLTEWAGLRWGARPPTEGLIFALSGALDFSYARSDELDTPVYLVGRAADLEDEYLTKVGAQFEVCATDDGDLGWKWVTDQLDRGTPVMVWADISHLPYLRVRLSMSRHDIVIAGYDDDRGVASVFDNDRDSVQLVPYEDLRLARSSTGFPVPTRHTTYIVDWPTKAPDLASIAGPALARSSQAMAAVIDNPAIAVSRNAAERESGLDGVKRFAADMEAWPDALTDESLEAVLFAVWAFIEKAGTGGGLFRTLQAAGCQRIADLLHSRAAGEAAKAAREASNAWTKVATTAKDPDASLRARAAAAAAAAARLPAIEARLSESLGAAGADLM
ncbi:PRTRC system protein E [Mycobacterium malmoense]|nr:BtrH N-terminal domain-containing protein [Mycobacterium malmoense]OCB29469.1 PRTRC system protein E [Mycobacterium malmoense]